MEPRQAGMDRALQSLQALYMEACASVKGFVKGATGLQSSLQQTVDLASKNMALLDGSDATSFYGNLYNAAMADNAAFDMWSDFAQSTADMLIGAIGTGQKWELGNFLNMSSNNLRETVADATPFLAGGMATVALVALAVIVLVVWR